MKLKKLILIIPLLFSLGACNKENSITGRYSFQLGSDTGTHAAIHLDLTNEVYPASDDFNPPEGSKKFMLSFDISGAGGTLFDMLANLDFESMKRALQEEISNEETSSEAVSSEQSSETSSSEVTSSDSSSGSESSSVAPKPFTIDGYYYTSKDEGSNLTRLNLGISILDIYEISTTIVEKIMYATVDGDTVNVVIPVSVKDLQYQLYWYGYRVASLLDVISPVNLIDEDPLFEAILAGNYIGTHPTKEAINAIQRYQQNRSSTKPEGYEIEEAIFDNYHDFHTLKMGLSKNG